MPRGPLKRVYVPTVLVLNHLAKNILQNTTVAVVFSLTWCIYTDNSVEFDRFAGILLCGNADGLRDRAILIESSDATN